MERVLLIGNGLMGSGVAEVLREEGFRVEVADKEPSRCTDPRVFDREHGLLPHLRRAIMDAEFIVICVNTETIEELYDDLAAAVDSMVLDGKVFVQRTTTLMGTTRRLASKAGIDKHVVMVPLFSYRSDVAGGEKNPPKVVIGGNDAWILATARRLFPWVKDEKFWFGSIEEAEYSKLVSNAAQAVILSMWNELETSALDFDWVMDTVVQEKPLASIGRVCGRAYEGHTEIDTKLLSKFWDDGHTPAVLMNAALAVNAAMKKHRGLWTAKEFSQKKMMNSMSSCRASKTLIKEGLR